MLTTNKFINIFLISVVFLISITSCNRDEVKAKNNLVGVWKCLKVEVKSENGIFFQDTKYGYIEFFEGDLFASTFDPLLLGSLFEKYTPSSGDYKLNKNGLTWNFTNRSYGDISYLFQVKSISNAKLELVFDIGNNIKQLYKGQDFDKFKSGFADEVSFTFTKLPNGVPANL